MTVGPAGFTDGPWQLIVAALEQDAARSEVPVSVSTVEACI